MARKKKTTEYVHSQYQIDIFDFVTHGHGNAVIEASAGSGKTYALVKCVDLIDEDNSILLTAFNKDIVTELKKRTKGKTNVSAMTMHSLGLNMLRSNFKGDNLTLDEFKYKAFINSNLKSLSSINTYSLSKGDYHRYVDNIQKYVDFGRYYLLDTAKGMDFIEERYGIETVADEKEVAAMVINWGMEDLNTIDYTDMVFLPNALGCKPYGLLFDWLLVDEAQDLSVAQRETLLKCRKLNTRMMAFGDKNQTIYSFASADPESFDELKALPNTISLPLSITYRCADSIVENAQKIVPTIEKNNDHRKGEIIANCQLSDVKDGDMILCRNNAPLMQVYMEYLRSGKKAFIRGKEIGLNLKNMVKKTKMEELNVKLNRDGVFVQLYDRMFDAINELITKCNITYSDALDSFYISNMYDMIRALEILSEGTNNADVLIERISDVFSDKKKDGISLSTIHKAKGLEADNVYIVCNSLMPSPKAKKKWEIEQEKNLMYVAYTRPKNKLGFIDESKFETFNRGNAERNADLKAIERKVNLVLGKQPKKVDTTNPYIAKEVIKHATAINNATPASKIIGFNNNSVNKFTKKNKKIGKYVML